MTIAIAVHAQCINRKCNSICLATSRHKHTSTCSARGLFGEFLAEKQKRLTRQSRPGFGLGMKLQMGRTEIGYTSRLFSVTVFSNDCPGIVPSSNSTFLSAPALSNMHFIRNVGRR